MRPRPFPHDREAARVSAAQSPAPRVAERFRDIYAVLSDRPGDARRKRRLASSQILALSVIASSRKIGVNNLAQRMGIHQSTASNLLRPMLKLGLVASTRSAEDGRAVHLNLTHKGRRLLKRSPGPFGGALTQALVTVDAATLRRLERDLSRVLKALTGEPRQP